MKYTPEIQSALASPDNLEEIYQAARQANNEAEFRADMQQAYEGAPDNLLLAAWHARFAYLPLAKVRRSTNWLLAVALGIITGLILWQVSDPTWLFVNQIPYLMVLWAPIATIPTMVFLALVSKKNYLYTALSAAVLIIATAYILLLAPGMRRNYDRDFATLMVITLPLLCWFALGTSVLKIKSSNNNRFAFLTKSIEVMITAGVYLIFGVAFGGITIAMFAALNLTFPEQLLRLLGSGGFGLIPVLAVATMYDPLAAPASQDFNQGLSRFVFTIMRLLLPLTLIVLVIYLFVIPFNFSAPFQNRNLLIIYNVMQFAIVGLLIGATPLRLDDLSEWLQVWLRRGLIAVAILALVISLYALSAVVYRTALDGITLNRLTIIGWNIINIVILGGLIYTQFTKGEQPWNERMQNVFSRATTPYLVWSLFLVIALPLVFR